jgi:hypothetical protein
LPADCGSERLWEAHPARLVPIVVESDERDQSGIIILQQMDEWLAAVTAAERVQASLSHPFSPRTGRLAGEYPLRTVRESSPLAMRGYTVSRIREYTLVVGEGTGVPDLGQDHCPQSDAGCTGNAGGRHTG